MQSVVCVGAGNRFLASNGFGTRGRRAEERGAGGGSWRWVLLTMWIGGGIVGCGTSATNVGAEGETRQSSGAPEAPPNASAEAPSVSEAPSEATPAPSSVGRPSAAAPTERTLDEEAPVAHETDGSAEGLTRRDFRALDRAQNRTLYFHGPVMPAASTSAPVAAEEGATAEGPTDALAVVSFRGEGDSVVTEVWVARREGSGARLVGHALMPHPPVPSYLDISVGGAIPFDEAVRILSRRIDDMDNDGRPELELVLSVSDEVVCGLGLLTHRYVLVYNLGPVALAADVRTGESATMEHFRGTVLWEDRNGDGHPDIHRRVRGCDDYGEDGACTRHTTEHTYLEWNPETDSWGAYPAQDVPCDEGE